MEILWVAEWTSVAAPFGARAYHEVSAVQRAWQNPAMILFQKRFHEGIRDGSITLTFRFWTRPQVRVGGRYRCHPIGVIEVTSIDRALLGAITEDEARRSGFDGRRELFDYMRGVAGDDLPDDREVFRVGFQYGGDGDRVSEALETDLDSAEVERIAGKLRGYDERSPDGPWTARTLELIRKHPRVAASKLAAKAGREKLAFKADVVKLKKLGLTQSFEVGYEVSPRGLEFLRQSKRKRSR